MPTLNTYKGGDTKMKLPVPIFIGVIPATL
jgi:hypothetical protein